jgi:DNA-binding MarR family transcriptional regulator
MSTVVVNPRTGLRLGAVLRQAWVGYRRRLDEELTAAGFGDHGFPDGRVLRICARSELPTIAHIGRELGISRQGAGKIVASLRERGYLTVSASTTNGREKVVALTPRAHEYLAAHRKASRRIEARLRRELGSDAFDGLLRIHAALDGDEQPALRDYLRSADLLG